MAVSTISIFFFFFLLSVFLYSYSSELLGMVRRYKNGRVNIAFLFTKVTLQHRAFQFSRSIGLCQRPIGLLK